MTEKLSIKTMELCIAGAILLLIGFGGAWFCLRQAQKWNEVKNEDIPDIKQNIWKRKKE